ARDSAFAGCSTYQQQMTVTFSDSAWFLGTRGEGRCVSGRASWHPISRTRRGKAKMITLPAVISDLTDEGDDVDRLLLGLDDAGWSLPTPAPGWTITHQVAHLIATFRMAALAASDPAAFEAMASRLSGDFDANVKMALTPYLAAAPSALLANWQETRRSAIDALSAVAPDQLVPWLVRPLPPAVLASAGLME